MSQTRLQEIVAEMKALNKKIHEYKEAHLDEYAKFSEIIWRQTDGKVDDFCDDINGNLGFVMGLLQKESKEVKPVLESLAALKRDLGIFKSAKDISKETVSECDKAEKDISKYEEENASVIGKNAV